MTTYGIGGLVSSHFFEVGAGRESEVVSKLRELGHRFLFKALGSFDVVSFLEVGTFDDTHIYTSCDGVISDCVIGAYRIQTDAYASPRIQDWIGNKAIVGFVALELDKLLYSPFPDGNGSGLEACVAVVSHITKLADSEGIAVSMFGGFGRSELFALVGSDKFEDVWRFATHCRRLKIGDCFPNSTPETRTNPVFASTVTTPAISYRNIRLDDDKYCVDRIQGRCQARIAVKCPPGFEASLRHHFPDPDKHLISAALGLNDCHVTTRADEPTKEVLESVLNFRRAWSDNVAAPLSTVTTVLFEQEDALGNPATAYVIDNSNQKVALRIPESLRRKSARLANRISAFGHRFNACLDVRSLLPAVLQLRNYMDYIQDRLDAYDSAYPGQPNPTDELYNDESYILEAVESGEIGLAQRIDNTFSSCRSPYQIPLPFGDGIFSSLIAVEYLINSVTSAWPEEGQECYCDYGFPVFSDSFGFSVRYGEVMFLPLEAIYDCTSASGSWLTLTHELSHAWYLRLRVAEEHKEEYEREYSTSFPWRRNASPIVSDIPFEDQLNELFAHWFDYYHFFNSDIDLYLTSIWRSWLRLPIVHFNFRDYIFRSFVVFLMSEIDDLMAASLLHRADLNAYLTRRWLAHSDRLRGAVQNFPITMLQWADSIRDAFIDLFFRYMRLLGVFYGNYRFDQFRDNLNRSYPSISDHAERILKGHVVLEKIPNPFCLSKAVIRANFDVPNRFAPLALVLSLKNQASWLRPSISQ